MVKERERGKHEEKEKERKGKRKQNVNTLIMMQILGATDLELFFTSSTESLLFSYRKLHNDLAKLLFF